MSEPTIHNQPECVECGGKCCLDFYICASASMTDAEVRQVVEERMPGWEMGRKVRLHPYPEFSPRRAFKAHCTWAINGQCSRYDDRPQACKQFPKDACECRFAIKYYKCALAKRLLQSTKRRLVLS